MPMMTRVHIVVEMPQGTCPVTLRDDLHQMIAGHMDDVTDARVMSYQQEDRREPGCNLKHDGPCNIACGEW